VGAVCTDGGSAVVRASVGSGGAAFSVAVDVVVRVSVKSGGTVFEVACLFSDSVPDDLGSTAVAESVDRDAGSSVGPGVSCALVKVVLLSQS
jgi:shikimate kinase